MVSNDSEVLYVDITASSGDYPYKFRARLGCIPAYTSGKRGGGVFVQGSRLLPVVHGTAYADTSARLVNDGFATQAPMRQWVLSLLFQIRYRIPI